MRRLGLLVLLISSLGAVASSPGDAVACAAMDIRNVPHEDRPYIRYHSLYHLKEGTRGEFLKPYSVHINNLSRRAKLRPFFLRQALDPVNLIELSRVISTDMVRIDTRQFKWPLEVYERLSAVEPYFHEPGFKFEEREVEEETGKLISKTWQGGVWPGDGKHYNKGDFNYQEKEKVKRKVRVPTQKGNLDGAFWLNPKETGYLLAETRSKIPVARADWFFVQTAISVKEERVATYYNFLELESRKDVERLAGLSDETTKIRESEIGSIFRKSGVASRNRQIFRFEQAGGGYYQTRDAIGRGTGKQNGIDNLNGDFVHQAQEIIFRLPNGLHGFHLNDAAGKQQGSAPDGVGPDKTSTSNDGRIHAPISCIRCHLEGHRNLKDYGRRLWNKGNLQVTYDRKQRDKFDQQYLRPLQQEVDDDNVKYARALAELNGKDWTPQKNAEAFKELFYEWSDADVTPEMAAREMGAKSAKELVFRLRVYASDPDDPVDGVPGLGQLLPQSVQGLLHNEGINREHFEEHFATLMKAYRWLIPLQPPDPNRPLPRLTPPLILMDHPKPKPSP